MYQNLRCRLISILNINLSTKNIVEKEIHDTFSLIIFFIIL